MLGGAGTTSACAENTCPGAGIFQHLGNYLRVRGEYWPQVLLRAIGLELPPRARRIHPGWPTNGANQGTTSACAENTHGRAAAVQRGWNYLRVRGEYGVLGA